MGFASPGSGILFSDWDDEATKADFGGGIGLAFLFSGSKSSSSKLVFASRLMRFGAVSVDLFCCGFFF